MDLPTTVSPLPSFSSSSSSHSSGNHRAMVDHTTVCCMCGDVGFPDKLFRCSRCLARFQHPYCSNYYEEDSTDISRVCDWCRSEDDRGVGGTRNTFHAKKHVGKESQGRSEYIAGERIKQEESVGPRAKSSIVGGPSASSSKSGGRRYKLLKDVLC